MGGKTISVNLSGKLERFLEFFHIRSKPTAYGFYFEVVQADLGL
jgi:hypothetical protein